MKRKKFGFFFVFRSVCTISGLKSQDRRHLGNKRKNLVFSLYFTRFALSLHACSDSHTTKTVLIRDNTKDSDAKGKQ